MRCYFDHNATTPVSPEAIEAMLPVLTESYGNASSIHHFGQAAKQRLEIARRQVARLLGARKATEIVFVSGGTEADNLAITGAVGASTRSTKHVITSTIEHPAVLNVCRELEAEGVAVTYVGVGGSGVIDVRDVRRALRPDTVLISIMHANNEVGTVQPVREIAELARESGVLFHSDGVQAAGKLPLEDTGADLYTVSGHKFGAPKGIGALYVRDKVKLAPLMRGGKQERERRPGTENVPGAVAMGRAAEWINSNFASETARIAELRDRLEREILASVPHARANCAASPRTPNTSNILFEGIEGEAMVIALDLKGFAVSSGAACSSGAVEPSHVLTAVGLSKDDARSCIRFSLGRQNDEHQVAALVEAVVASAAHLRRLSPVAVG
ncbi:MAG TPA: cysteine desulfurase family protein [Bryobacteraceae bacterium]